MQISVQIGLNWNWPTGTELGSKKGKRLDIGEVIDTKQIRFSEAKWYEIYVWLILYQHLISFNKMIYPHIFCSKMYKQLVLPLSKTTN